MVGSGDITDRSDLVGEPCICTPPGDIFAGDGEFLSEARALFAAGLVGVDGLPAFCTWYIMWCKLKVLVVLQKITLHKNCHNKLTLTKTITSRAYRATC